MDLVFTVGAYDLLAMAFRSFGVELDDDLASGRDVSADEAAGRKRRTGDGDPPASSRSRARLDQRGRAPRTACSSSSTPRSS